MHTVQSQPEDQNTMCTARVRERSCITITTGRIRTWACLRIVMRVRDPVIIRPCIHSIYRTIIINSQGIKRNCVRHAVCLATHHFLLLSSSKRRVRSSKSTSPPPPPEPPLLEPGRVVWGTGGRSRAGGGTPPIAPGNGGGWTPPCGPVG